MDDDKLIGDHLVSATAGALILKLRFILDSWYNYHVFQALPKAPARKEAILFLSIGSCSSLTIPLNMADFNLLRSDYEGDRAISGLDLRFTDPKSGDTPITIFQDEPIKRTMSPVEALGIPESSEWDCGSAAGDVMIAGNKPASSVMGITGRQHDCLDLTETAQMESKAKQCTKVICKFTDGENEVSYPPCQHRRSTSLK